MSMKSAVEDAVMTANQGKASHTLASGPVWGNDDAAMRSKVSWSVLRSGAEGGYVYWIVLDDTTEPEIAARKLRVSCVLPPAGQCSPCSSSSSNCTSPRTT